MAGLEGTIKTPMGPVSKKTALYAGGFIVVLGGIVWYRHRQSAGTATVDSTATATDAEIDPATGYPYGSPEDAAALQGQSNYVTPVPTGGGSSSIPTTGTGYSSNGAWVQGVVEYMIQNNLVSDPSALSAALGVFITGSYATNDQVSLINQAIAVQGYPPVSGPSGYPPAINRNPPQGTGTTTPSSTAAPTGLKVVSVSNTAVTLSWNAVAGAKGYQSFLNGAGHGTTYYNGITATNLKPNTQYTIGIKTVNSAGTVGPMATIAVKTTNKK